MYIFTWYIYHIVYMKILIETNCWYDSKFLFSEAL